MENKVPTPQQSLQIKDEKVRFSVLNEQKPDTRKLLDGPGEMNLLVGKIISEISNVRNKKGQICTELSTGTGSIV